MTQGPERTVKRKDVYDQFIWAKGHNCSTTVDTLGEDVPQSQTSGGFPQQLYRKHESDRQEVSVQIDDGFETTVESLDASIQQRHEAYDPEATPIDSPLLRTVFRVFSGYDLTETSLDIRRRIVGDTFMSDFFDKENAQFSTPPEVADVLVEVAAISKNETVLDPASGWGYTPRAANEYTENVFGVEIHSGVNNAALLFNDLLENTGEYITGDFLEMVINQNSKLPNDIEHIILDPSMGERASKEVTEYIDEPKRVRIHEAFVSLALDRLKEGGRLTAVVPTSVLTADRCAWLRERIVVDHTQGIIEISEPGPFSYHSADLAIVIVDETRAGISAEFPGVVYYNLESPSDLKQAARHLQSQDVDFLQVNDPSESMLPSERLGMQRAADELSERFSKLAQLGEIASEITQGVHL